jgi:phage head maturation protease
MKPEATISETGEITGYAYTFEDEEIQGGPAEGGWIERIDRNALNIPQRNIRLLLNFGSQPLAQTKDDTLHLTLDDIGLKVMATSRSTWWTKPFCRALIKSGFDIGVTFTVEEQRWSAAPGFGPLSFRHITKMKLIDVSLTAKQVVAHG